MSAATDGVVLVTVPGSGVVSRVLAATPLSPSSATTVHRARRVDDVFEHGGRVTFIGRKDAESDAIDRGHPE